MNAAATTPPALPGQVDNAYRAYRAAPGPTTQTFCALAVARQVARTNGITPTEVWGAAAATIMALVAHPATTPAALAAACTERMV